jgi:putative oxidoreductase
MKLSRFFETIESFGPLLLRLGLAAVMFPHGAQKVLGLFGGLGFAETLGFFTGKLGIPTALAVTAIFTEFFAPIALFFGFFTRLAGFALAVDLAVAAYKGGHIFNGFFMNWMGHQKGEGFEFHLLVVAIGLALAIMGGGRWSVDSWIAWNLGGPRGGKTKA